MLLLVFIMYLTTDGIRCGHILCLVKDQFPSADLYFLGKSLHHGTNFLSVR